MAKKVEELLVAETRSYYKGVQCFQCKNFVASRVEGNRFGQCKIYGRTVFTKYGCFGAFEKKL